MTQPVWSADLQTGMALERAANVLAFRHRDARAHQDGGDDARLGWCAFDLPRDEAGEHIGPLRVSNQHHAAAVVVVLQVIVPGVFDILVANPLVERHAFRQPARPGVH